MKKMFVDFLNRDWIKGFRKDSISVTVELDLDSSNFSKAVKDKFHQISQETKEYEVTPDPNDPLQF